MNRATYLGPLLIVLLLLAAACQQRETERRSVADRIPPVSSEPKAEAKAAAGQPRTAAQPTEDQVSDALATWMISGPDSGAPAAKTAEQPEARPETQPAGPAPERDDKPSVTPEESHQKMVALIKWISLQTPDENTYLGDREVKRLRQYSDGLPPGTSDLNRCRFHFQLGLNELRLGREHEAIDQLTRAYQLLSSPEVKSALGRDGAVELAFQLGVAHMRLGETENCCARNTPDSCILPIRGEGIHTKQEPSRTAIRYFTEVLGNSTEQSATHLRARWLLNIAFMTLGEFPDAVPDEHLIPLEAFESDEPFPRFVNISSHLGIDTFTMCGGAAADDFDGDGNLDLVVSNWDPAGQLRFFRNNADGTFSDRTTAAGLDGICGGLNVVQADYNNDGHVDILVLRGAWFSKAGLHPNSLIRNNGDGTFTDVTFAAGLGEVHYPTQTASWADYDNDGDLDLYIGNEHAQGVVAPCQLFQNNGDGTFTDVAASAKVANNRFTKAVVWGDYDDDRWPDLYVSNLGAENRLYRNNGHGTFTDVAPKLGVTHPVGSFPAWFFDVDNDGVLDLFVSSYSNQIEQLAASYIGMSLKMELACLYRGDGQGGFDEVSKQWNLIGPTTPMGSNFGDIDGDGYLDFYLGTGDPQYYNLMPNVMYRNRDGKRFADVTTAGGFGHLQKGHAVIFADLDNDGDQDVFEQLGGAFPGDRFHDALYENPGFENHWIAIQLVGAESNRSAIGARLRLDVAEGDTTRTIYKHVNSGGSFGGNPLRQNIGLGRAERIERIEVFWPTTGLSQTFTDVPMDGAIRIVEGQSQYLPVPLKPFRFQIPRD